jgi:hypothetical protein
LKPATTSTTFISGTGLKKWKPAKRSGRFRPAAMAVTESDEVLVTSVAVGAHHDAFELAEQLALDLEVFDHGFDHQVAAGQRLQGVDGLHAGDVRVARGGVDLALLVQLVPLRDEGFAAALGGAGEAVEQQHFAAGLGGDLRDAATHGAGADDADSGVVHCHLLEGFAGWVVSGACRAGHRCRCRCCEASDFASARARGVTGFTRGAFEGRQAGRRLRSMATLSAMATSSTAKPTQLIQAAASLASSQPPSAAPTAWPV